MTTNVWIGVLLKYEIYSKHVDIGIGIDYVKVNVNVQNLTYSGIA